MRTHDESRKDRKLRVLEVARVAVGLALIIAALAVVVTSFSALAKERDAWVAMRTPLISGVLLTWIFAWIAKAIVNSKTKPTACEEAR